MPEFNIGLKRNIVPEKARLSALEKCYSYILSLPNPREKKTENVVTDLGGDEAALSVARTSTYVDETPSNLTEDSKTIGDSL